MQDREEAKSAVRTGKGQSSFSLGRQPPDSSENPDKSKRSKPIAGNYDDDSSENQSEANMKNNDWAL